MARLMTIGRDNRINAETVAITAIESGVPTLVDLAITRKTSPTSQPSRRRPIPGHAFNE